MTGNLWAISSAPLSKGKEAARFERGTVRNDRRLSQHTSTFRTRAGLPFVLASIVVGFVGANFDMANVRQEDWGTLTFTFSDCHHGHVDWVSSAPGYASGGMDLTRLTSPAELLCE